MSFRRGAPRGSSTDGGEESYLASVSDLMSGLLFFFIITLVIFAISLKHKESDYQDALQRSKLARKEMLLALQATLARDNLIVTINQEQGVLRLGNQLLFDSASDSLTAVTRHNLLLVASALDTVLPRYVRPGALAQLEAVFIEGHTDSIPISTPRFVDNLTLSTARARQVYLSVMDARPRLKTLHNSDGVFLFSASGYGDRVPINDNSTEDNRRSNRRIDLRFIMASRLPAPGIAVQRAVAPQ